MLPLMSYKVDDSIIIVVLNKKVHLKIATIIGGKKMNYTINLLNEECWWGGLVQDGIYMPFRNVNMIRDLEKEQRGNQSSPFLVSNKGRYIWSEEAFTFQFLDNCIQISAKGDVILEEDHSNLRAAYIHASNRFFPADGHHPDEFLFTRPQYNTWIEMMYEPTQQKILDYAKAILDNGMPPGVLVIDDNWQEDYGVWNFHPGRFDNPKGMIEKLHEMGFKVMLWVCNFVSPDSVIGRLLEEKEYLVKSTTKKSAIVHWWNGYSFMLDITNENAVTWFKAELNRLMHEFGVDGFKFDAGDSEFMKEDFISKRPINGNEYTMLWVQIGLDYPFNEYRACWKMGGKSLAQRLSDKNHSWNKDNGLGSLIPNGLAQGLLGYAYNCPDMIGGGEYKNFLKNSKSLDMELIVRNAECAALFPMMQFSVAPWKVLDEKHLRICVEMARLHQFFGEKILELVKEAAISGEPIIRPLEYVYPDCGLEQIVDQFMLGDDILVAPVLQKGDTKKKIVFPEGAWQGDDNTIVEGPCTLIVEAPLSRLPWYKRLNRIGMNEV